MDKEKAGVLADLTIWFAVLLAAFGGSSLLRYTLIKSDLFSEFGAPVLMLAMFFVASALLRRRGESWRSVGFARPVSVGRTAGLVVGGYVAMMAMSAFVKLVVFRAVPGAQPSLALLQPIVHNPLVYAGWLLLAWTSAALGEEFQFRGFAQSRLEKLFGPGKGAALAAVIGQAVLFGLAHLYQGLPGVVLTGGAGLVLGAVYLLGRRTLVASMLLHALTDTISLTILFLGLAPSS